jgi:hypothetical protein
MASPSAASGSPPAGPLKKATIGITRDGLRTGSLAKQSSDSPSNVSDKQKEEKPFGDSDEGEDLNEGDTLEDVEAQTEGMTVAFVAFSRQHAEHKELILRKINEALESCPELDDKSE